MIFSLVIKKPHALLLGVIALITLSCFMLMPSKASAFGVRAATANGPTTNSAIYNPSSNNTTITPFYDVGDTGDYPFSNLFVSAFVDDSVTGPIKFTFQNGSAVCHGYTSAGVVGPDYTLNSPPLINVYADGAAAPKTISNGCSSSSEVSITTNAGAATAHSGSFYTSRYKKSIWIDITLVGGANSGENSFRIITDSNCPAGDGKCVLIAIDPHAGDTVGLGFRASPSGCTGCSGNINNGNHWDGEIMFAPNATCADINKNSLEGSVGIADPDGNNSAWNSNLIIKIQHQKLDANGNPTGGWGDVGLQFGPNWWPDSDHTVHWLANNTQFPLGWRYRVEALNVGVRNTIKFKFGQNVSQISAADYWSVNKCYGFKCTNLTYTPSILNPGDSVTVSVTVQNTGALGWTAGTQLMKRQPGYHSIALTTDVAPGGSTTIKNTFAVQFTDTYTYSMYINSNTVMPNTGPGQWCPITIPVTNAPPPTPYLAVQSCSSATVENVNSSNIQATYSAALTPITKVPVEIVVKDDSGSPIYNYVISGGVTKDSGSYTVNMADLWTKANMFPHNDYQLTLVVQGTKAENSATYTNNGAWSGASGTFYTPVTFNTARIQNCWEADCSGDYTTTTDAEPGQNVDVQVGFKIVNKSPRPFNNVNYYNALPAGDGQGVTTSSGPVAMNIPAQFSGTIPATFTIKLDYKGTYSAVLRFASTPLTDVCTSPPITPSTRPFFQVWNGNIYTGGSFLDSLNQCPATMPDYVSPSTTGDSNYGGIKAYSNISTGHGSSADFGALALGLVASKPADYVGFNAHSTFANVGGFPPDSLGGYLNSTSAAHCVTDFYDSTQNNPQPQGAAPGTTSDLTGSSTSQYSWDGPVEPFEGGQVNSNQHIVLYVNGDVTIDGNITYGSWNRDDPNSAPFFALIVRGSITLTNNVTRLDGLYVAQPVATGSTSGGNFDTCDDFCNNQLLINGAVVAQSVHLLRSFGTLATNSTIVSKPAEIINYIPSMLIGAQYLNPSHNNVQTLLSLPPAL